MNIWIKILFTVPVLIQVFYAIANAYPTEFRWLFPSMEVYYIHVVAYLLLRIVVATVLIRRIWQYIHINRKRKWNWTWFLVFMGNIAVLFYAWSQDAIFQKENISSPTIDKDNI
ncbi:MAG: hypothetical protein ACFHU9_17225 [Fluviicola sp.]